MRRRFYIVAFALFVAVPLWAQRGGGHAGGGGHAVGFAGRGGFSGHGGGFVGAHMGSRHFGGMHGGPGISRGFRHGPGSGFSRFSSRGFHRRGPVISNFGFNRRCFGCRRRGFAYPWWGYSGFYDPYWYWD